MWGSSCEAELSALIQKEFSTPSLQALKQHPSSPVEHTWRVTISVGMAPCPHPTLILRNNFLWNGPRNGPRNGRSSISLLCVQPALILVYFSVLMSGV